MTALVVYESMFGNTQEVAVAIRSGLEDGGLDARLVEVGDAPARIGEEHALLVIGGPTHAFGLSRESTRSDAARRAEGPVVSRGRGLRDWLDEVQSSDHPRFATFDTKVRHPRLPGSAARAAAKRLRHQRWTQVAGAETFYVDDLKGPLCEGEVERARRWGAGLAAVVDDGRTVPA